MTIEDWFELYEKAARWREMAKRVGDRRATEALRTLADKLDRKARRLSVWAGEDREGACNLADDAVPVVGLALAKNPHAGIPGRIGPVHQPAPAGVKPV
jgi:hypothetical protein